MADTSLYTTGGTVQAGEGVYLSRRADDELFALCREGTCRGLKTPRPETPDCSAASGLGLCVPDGIRTRVTGLKGQRPGPLDDGDLCESRGDRTPDPRLKRPVLYQLS